MNPQEMMIDLTFTIKKCQKFGEQTLIANQLSRGSLCSNTLLNMHLRQRASETYTDMLKRISSVHEPDSPALIAYRQFMTEIVAERDIGAQETCHMLQKLPLVVCNRPFTSLNVGRKMFKRIIGMSNTNQIQSTYL